MQKKLNNGLSALKHIFGKSFRFVHIHRAYNLINNLPQEKNSFQNPNGSYAYQNCLEGMNLMVQNKNDAQLLKAINTWFKK